MPGINGLPGVRAVGRQGALLNLNQILKDGATWAYYDFEDQTTATKDGSGYASRVNDKLGSGHDLLQASQTSKPQFIGSDLYFNGVLNKLKTASQGLTLPCYVYAVLKPMRSADGNRFWDGLSNGSMGLNIIGSIQNIAIDVASGVSNPSAQVGIYQVVRVVYNNTNSSIQINDLIKTTGNGGTTNPNGLTIGNLGVASFDNISYAQMYIKAMIVRTAPLSASKESFVYKTLRSRIPLNHYNNILVLGNSITKHPIVSYWWGEWGMAASSREYDFVHKLQSRLRQFTPTCNVVGQNIAVWETAYETYDKSNFDSYFASNPDCVVIRLGENVTITTDFVAPFQALIDYVKSKAPTARIVVSGCFWGNSTKETVLRNVASTNGLTFMKLDYLNIAANVSSIGSIVGGDDGQNHTVNDAGVALHPNDTGMQAIADVIYNTIA